MRQANLGLNLTAKRTRKREFLDEMKRVVPWGELAALISPHALEGKASMRATAEHPFRVNKLQFGFVKARCRGLKKNTAQLTTLFALPNLWRERRKLMKM